MTEQVQEAATPLDAVKLTAALAIMIAGLAGFYALPWPIWARWLAVLAGLGVGGLVGVQSHQGKAFWQFIQSSRVELRKVVWRDRDAPSTLQVALVVFVVVAVLAVFFWLVDLGLSSVTRWVLDQGA